MIEYRENRFSNHKPVAALRPTGQIFSSASVTKDIQISNSTGSVRIEDMVAGSIQISVSTGKIAIKGVVCFGDLSTDLTTGKANFTNIGKKASASKEIPAM